MRYRLSPYCILCPDADGRHATLIHSLYGSKFQATAELFQALAQALTGYVDPKGGQDPLSGAIEELIAEKVLIDEGEYQTLGGEALFENRLRPLEMAFLREFNEGGYSSGAVDPAKAPKAIKRVRGLESIALEQHVELPRSDVAECLRARRSIRNYARGALPKRKLEQFLQLTARAYGLMRSEELGETSLRNYPSGGARYPLEIYPLVENVQSVNKGIYHYRPFEHRLELVNRDRRYRAALMQAALGRMGVDAARAGRPAVLFLVTAVHGRTAWKYRGIPLHLILQEVGALYQTMYLAATALELAPCAIGAFPERAVAEILNLDIREESQVGLFALGVPGKPASLSIEDFEVRRGSPFNPDQEARSVELTFSDGLRETIDFSDFCVERSESGVVRLRVRGGRQRAELGEKARRKLDRMAKGKRSHSGPRRRKPVSGRQP